MTNLVYNILYKKYLHYYKIVFNNNLLLQYIDSKIINDFNIKQRRNLMNLYCIYSLLHFYILYNKVDQLFHYSDLIKFCRSLYTGNKMQNHAYNTRVNNEFKNKFHIKDDLIININNQYKLNIKYVYSNHIDISEIYILIIKQYITELQNHDLSFINTFYNLSFENKITALINILKSNIDARLFKIISYTILKNYYKHLFIYIGIDKDNINKQYLQLIKLGKANANDGGIDFILLPLGLIFQVTESLNYSKYILDIQKTNYNNIIFVIKTNKSKSTIHNELMKYINNNQIYINTIKDIITVNELIQYINISNIDDIINDIIIQYKIEFNLD